MRLIFLLLSLVFIFQTYSFALIVNINTASVEELDYLERIGPAKAKAIVIHRERHGDFKTIEEIMNVKGIGEKIFLVNRHQISISGPTIINDSSDKPRKFQKKQKALPIYNHL